MPIQPNSAWQACTEGQGLLPTAQPHPAWQTVREEDFRSNRAANPPRPWPIVSCDFLTILSL